MTWGIPNLWSERCRKDACTHTQRHAPKLQSVIFYAFFMHVNVGRLSFSCIDRFLHKECKISHSPVDIHDGKPIWKWIGRRHTELAWEKTMSLIVHCDENTVEINKKFYNLVFINWQLVSKVQDLPPERAFADFVLCNLVLHLVIMNFLG